MPRPPAARPWSGRTTRPWATSAAPAPPPTSGNGPSRACGRWPSTPRRAASSSALEYLNRFECYLLNTAADGARFCREVNHPRCKMMYDTFHSHIEEKNTPAAIRALKDCLAHVHISENDRSTPGQGNVRWAETFDTLKEIGYDNLMVIEAFGLALDKIVAATKIWRRMYQSEQQLATDGLAVHEGASGEALGSRSIRAAELADPKLGNPSPQEGISLDELAQAFAQVMGTAPGEAAGRRPPDARRPRPARKSPLTAESRVGRRAAAGAGRRVGRTTPAARSARGRILEAMLFVGDRDNRPLTAARAAELMRGVEPGEIPGLVHELNQRYAASGCPVQHRRARATATGWRCGQQFHVARPVSTAGFARPGCRRPPSTCWPSSAYQQPLTAEQIGTLRGKPSSHVLSQLVHRGLLRIERLPGKRRVGRSTSPRTASCNCSGCRRWPICRRARSWSGSEGGDAWPWRLVSRTRMSGSLLTPKALGSSVDIPRAVCDSRPVAYT